MRPALWSRRVTGVGLTLVIIGTLGFGIGGTIAAGPDEIAGRAYLATTLGAEPLGFELLYQRTGAIRSGAGDPQAMWVGKFLDRRTGAIETVYRIDGLTGGIGLLRDHERSAEAGLTALERKSSPALLRTLRASTSAGGQLLSVAVWLAVDTSGAEASVIARHPNVTWLGGRPIARTADQGRTLRTELWLARQDVYAAAASRLGAALAGLGGTVGYASTSAPVVFVDAPISAFAAIANRADVTSLGLEGRWTLAMSSAGPTVDANWTTGTQDLGTGVRVGVVEYDNVHNTSDLAGKVVSAYSTTGTLHYAPGFDHPTWVAGAIASQNSTYPGVAPGAVIVSAGTGGYPGASVTLDRAVIAAADWTISPTGGNADLVNTSLGQDTATGSEEARRYFDAVVAESSCLAVSAAGNYSTFNSWDIVSPGTGWNVLTVGAVDDKQTTSRADDRIWYVAGSNGSNWQDPLGTAWNTHGDFNKPNLVAPGVLVQTANGLNATGTSVATPIVSGVAAQVLANEPELLLWPEGTRAVLMASAIYTVTMPDGSVQRDRSGTGMASALWANRIATAGNGAYGGYRIDAVVKGQTLVQQVTVNAGDRVRVALAWNSHTSGANLTKTDVLQADLDLRVTPPGGGPVGSYTFDNAYEFVEVVAPTSGTLTIEVLQSRFDGASERVGLAWAKIPGPIPPATSTPTPTPDLVAPTIVSRSPASGASGASMTPTITVGFSESVTGVTSASLALKDGATVVPSILTYDAPSRVATLRPTAPLAPLRAYTVSATGAIRDTAGNALAPTSWSWTTAWNETYSPARTLSFVPGTYVAYRFDANGDITASRTRTFNKTSTAPTTQRSGIVNQSGGWYYIGSGRWAGYWIREGPGITLQ